jgi:uncharacterized membrane protein YfcA
MGMATAVIASFIFLYAIVQSVFGVGLLVFGTPTLLLLGYPFEQTLSYLLPCSVAVNILQITANWKEINLKRDFTFYCLPFVITGLAFVIRFHAFNIKIYVGILMVSTALIRTSELLRNALQNFSQRYSRPALVTIGALHGLTNMGGGLLSIFVGALHRGKSRVRSNIAFGYLLMAACQLLVLLATRHFYVGWESAVFLAIAMLTYTTIGNKAFKFPSEASYQNILTVFISIFGILLLATGTR